MRRTVFTVISQGFGVARQWSAPTLHSSAAGQRLTVAPGESVTWMAASLLAGKEVRKHDHA